MHINTIREREDKLRLQRIAGFYASLSSHTTKSIRKAKSVERTSFV